MMQLVTFTSLYPLPPPPTICKQREIAQSVLQKFVSQDLGLSLPYLLREEALADYTSTLLWSCITKSQALQHPPPCL